MSKRFAAVAALLCLLVSLPVFAGGNSCNDAIASLAATDVQTGQVVAITWSYGVAGVQSQTLSGHDLAEPVALAPGQTSYTYVAGLPGEKHVTLTAVTDCGTVSRTIKYHVEQCNVVAPVLNVDKTSVLPGETINASIDLLPGHTARWVVGNGTASATSGAAIQIVAGAPGAVTIDVYVARGNSCEVKSSASVTVASPCAIVEPEIWTYPSSTITPNMRVQFAAFAAADETVTYAVRGAEVIGTDPFLDLIAPSSGSFEVDFTVSNATCSRTFTRVYEVTPCEPTATVTAGGTTCSPTVVVNFTGTPPFSGYFSNGAFFSTSSTRIERTFNPAGTYSVAFFRDRYCTGTATGSVAVAGALPIPFFYVDDFAGGYWYGLATCPGIVRTAIVTTPIPAGTEVVWTIGNATIVSGQGTGTVEFYANEPGPVPISAVIRNAEGCTSRAYEMPYLTSHGTPEVTVSVDPATIGAGGTATVTVTSLNPYVMGMNVTSSLGDSIQPILSDDPFVFRYEYVSTHGGGVATITAEAINACGVSSTASTTLTIDGGAPVQATATVRALGSSCSDYVAYAELTGTAPFTGTWNNGVPFYSDWPGAYLYPTEPGTYTIAEFSDANGPGTVTGEATFNFTPLPQADFAFSATSVCPNGTLTASLTTPIPDGATAQWEVWGGTILSGQGTGTIEIQAGEYFLQAAVRYSAPDSCGPLSSWQSVYVATSAQQPSFDVFPIAAGETTHFSVWLDPNTATWDMSNSLGDAMEVIDNSYPGLYLIRYTSSHGAGESTIRIWGTTTCGTSFEGTRVLTISQPRPTATLTSTPDPLCGATITATFTGTPPFTGTWSDTGETFTTNESSVSRKVKDINTWIYLRDFSDGTGQIGASGSVFTNVTIPPYVYFGIDTYLCVGSTATATAFSEIPAGFHVVWELENGNARIVSGQGTAQVVIEGVEAGQVLLSARLSTAEGCEGSRTGSNMTIEACPTGN